MFFYEVVLSYLDSLVASFLLEHSGIHHSESAFSYHQHHYYHCLCPSHHPLAQDYGSSHQWDFCCHHFFHTIGRVSFWQCRSDHVSFLFKTFQWLLILLRRKSQIFALPSEIYRTRHLSYCGFVALPLIIYTPATPASWLLFLLQRKVQSFLKVFVLKTERQAQWG